MFSIFICDHPYSIPSKVRNSREFPTKQVHGTIVKTNKVKNQPLDKSTMENRTIANAATGSSTTPPANAFKADTARIKKLDKKAMEDALKEVLITEP